MMTKNKKLIVGDVEISIQSQNQEDYICLTDMATFRDGDSKPDVIIQNWLRNKDTIEYLGVWEQLNNPNFKPFEFEGFKKSAGLNRFTLSPKKWIESTNAIGMTSKSGKYGGTYAHKDIAFNFGMWISPEFQLYVVREYQRLKEVENNTLNIEWSTKRLFSKMNYKLHTDAIQKHIILKGNYAKEKEWLAFADEADMLNVIVFGCTAKDWRDANMDRALAGENMRDMASICELLILANLESLNSILIQSGISKDNRFNALKQMAQSQMASLDKNDKLKFVKKTSDDIYINSKGLPQIEKKDDKK
jgi:hypothetical protein